MGVNIVRIGNTVETIPERYKLFEDWKKTRKCTLTGGDLDLLKSFEVKDKIYIAIVTGLAVILWTLAVALMGDLFKADFQSGVKFFSSIFAMGVLLIAVSTFDRFNSYIRRDKKCNNREYFFEHGAFEAGSETYKVKYDVENDKIVIIDKADRQCSFKYKLENDGKFKVYWGRLTVGLTSDVMSQLERM